MKPALQDVALQIGVLVMVLCIAGFAACIAAANLLHAIWRVVVELFWLPFGRQRKRGVA